MKEIVKEAGRSYYFSHEIIEQLEKKEICIVDKLGKELIPSYFGAGINGMSGILKYKFEENKS